MRDEQIEAELSEIEAQGLSRTLIPLSTPVDAEVEVGGRRLLMLSSNDYLGLANHPSLRGAATAATDRFGSGSGASRLVSGDLRLHHELEGRLARLKGTEAALLFTSGYHANVGTLSALLGTEDQVFSDSLNHASIIDGCRLSRARVFVYPHRDVAALTEQLESAPPARRRLVVTDSVFSMDGDIAPLEGIHETAVAHGASVMVDEAHATGVFGPRGGGLAEALGLTGSIQVNMGTLGKALGSFGAYVAGSRALIRLLLNRARSFVYTTAPPPGVVAAALAAVDIVSHEPERRRALWARASQLRGGLADLGFHVGGESHIVPLFVGENAPAMALAEALLEAGVFARAIRPPTVPAGTARIRLTPMATHSEQQIEQALSAIAEAGRRCGLIDAKHRPTSRRAEPSPLTGAPSTRQQSKASPRRLAEWDHRTLWHPFTQMTEWLAEEPLIIERGEGNYLIDFDGHRYLDGVSSLWCNVHGHNRPEINEAIRSQLDRIAHTTLLGLASEPSIVLAASLIERVPEGLTRVFYSDAGATAVEVALRMALQYWQLTGNPRRDRFASLVGAYHGDTLGAVGVGYSEPFHRYVRSAVHESIRLTPPHVFRWERGYDADAALEAAITEARREISKNADRLAAVIVEPLMQGAAGMWPHRVEYLQALRTATEHHGILLICDEVATGFGRTGKLFACEHAAVRPDLLCLGKGITGGYLPLAATIATENVFEAFLGRYDEYRAFFHGHTYTGNALACAAGIASLDLFDREKVLDRLPALVSTMGSRLSESLEVQPHVGDARQWGMMVGLELVRDRAAREPYPPAARIGARVAREARRHGVILRPLGDVMVLMPPLSITHDELVHLMDALLAAIESVTHEAT